MSCQPNPPCLKPASRAFVPPAFIPSIKKTKTFKHVYSCGSQAVNAYFAVYVAKNDSDTSRLGISVSKKVGIAVVRSRVKRLVRESCRLRAPNIARGFDIVVVARPAVGALPREGSFAKVDKALEALFGRLQLLDVNHG